MFDWIGLVLVWYGVVWRCWLLVMLVLLCSIMAWHGSVMYCLVRCWLVLVLLVWFWLGLCWSGVVLTCLV